LIEGHSSVEFAGFGGDIPVVHLFGEADSSAAADLRARLQELQEATHPNVVIDLLEVTFVDSTILGVLVAASRFCRNLGGELRLVIAEPRVSRVLEITGLTRVFVLYGSLEAALHAA